MTPRRKFLFDCSSAIAVLALIPLGSVGAVAVTAEARPASRRLNYAVLAGQVNTLFQARLSPQQSVGLKLLQARRAPSAPAAPGRRPPADAGNEKFSLIFSGPKDALLDSAIHQFEHPQLGRFEMHIGQIGRPDADSVRYEAVFNQPAAMSSSSSSLTPTRF